MTTTKRKFDDGAALFAAARESGLRGRDREAPLSAVPSGRAWLDQDQDRAHWRYGEEIESLRKCIERRQAR